MSVQRILYAVDGISTLAGKFAAWLVVTLRVGAISAGWDVQWLGRTVPEQWLTPSRAVTLAAYAFVTLTLYNNLFRDDLERSRFGPGLRLAQWLTLPLLIGSVTLPYRVYLPITWVFTGVGLVLMCASLVRIVFKTRSRVAMWYGASLGVTFLSTVPPTAGLVAKFFGVGHMATLFGVVMLTHQVGGFLGAWLGGQVFQATGSFDIVWMIDIGLAVAAALLHLPIREAPVVRPQAAAA